MRPEQRRLIKEAVLKARSLLEEEISGLLEGTYGLRKDGTLEEASSLPALREDPEAALTRQALESYLGEQESQGKGGKEAREALVKEAAFTHLNRLVAIKMMEQRKLIRGTVNRGLESNQFKHWLAENEEALKLYQRGEKDRAYRLFLDSLYGELSSEIKVLFDPQSLPSRLFPRPTAFSELLSLLNHPELEPAWAEDEAIGWVYQYFSSKELEQAFREARVSGKKFSCRDIPNVTQLFTPRWIVEYLVQNTLGRLWLNMHPDSDLKEKLPYLVPLQGEQPPEPLRPVKEITLLDPACGTMHFGLVAFDLFYEMYREELKNAGREGWPDTPSVEKEEDIPASIIACNLYGADIDLRAVQLSALSLYLKAKTKNPAAEITSSNLACAEVLPIDGEKLDQFIEKTSFSHPVIPRLLRELWPTLKQTSCLGSLARIERDVSSLIEREKRRAEEDRGRLFGEDLEHVSPPQEEGWRAIEREILSSLETFSRSLSPEAYFAREAEKGIRLLDLLRRRYDVVVTNPPYLSNRKMDDLIQKHVKDEYPNTKTDFYACFIERCLELAREQGYVGMLSMHSFMFITSYEALRDSILDEASIETLAHAGPGLFEVGNPGTLQTAAYVLRREPDARRRDESIGTYIRLVKEGDKQAAFERALRTGENIYHLRQEKLRAIPGHPWVYWVPDSIRQLFAKLPRLGDIAQPRQGLATADNFRFLRFWWEVGKRNIAFGCKDREEALASGKKWFPCMKGGSYRKWYGNQEYVVNWWRDGEEIKNLGIESGRIASRPQNTDYYFREGITWSKVTQSDFAVRYSPGGFIFDVAGCSLFPNTNLIKPIMAMLNSRLTTAILNQVSPTVNYEVGHIASIPIDPSGDMSALEPISSHLISLRRLDSTEDDTTYDFIAPLPWRDGLGIKKEREEEISRLEAELDELVYDLYGISAEDRKLIAKELSERAEVADEGEGEEGPLPKEEEEPREEEEGEYPLTREELAFRWLSYALGIVLGRFAPGEEGELGSAIVEDEREGKKHLFSPEVEEKLRALTDPDGICVLDPGHGDDLPTRAEEALTLMLGEEGAREVIGELGGDLRRYLSRDFFKEHCQIYRRRPCYWYLATGRKNYGFYLFCERVDKDTLFKIKTNYLNPKLKVEKNRLKELREKEGRVEGRERRALLREMEEAEAYLSELEDFASKLDGVISLGYDPHPDDGVLINLSPLRELVPWPKKGELEKTWRELSSGSYDWSHMAMRLFPERVKEKCEKDKSLRIAHGLE